MKNFKYMFLLFCSIFVLISYNVFSETAVSGGVGNFEYFKFKTQIYKLEEIRNRVDLGLGTSRFIYINVRKEDEPVYSSFGFSFPWITVGPLTVKGLLREINNPLGYSALSNVFKEYIDINLNGSFTDPGKNGLLIEIIPDVIGIYQYNSSEISKFGGFLSYKNDLSVELLFSASRPEKEAVPDSWYLDAPVFPGGMLFHNAYRLAFKVPSLFASLSGCISSGELVKQGYFTNIDFIVKTDFMELAGLAGFSSDSYFNPDGKDSNYRSQYNADIWIKAIGPLSFGGGYWIKKEHPGNITDLYTESREGFLIKSRIDINFNRNISFVLDSKYLNEYQYDDTGNSVIKKNIDSKLLFRISRLKSSINHIISFIDTEKFENNLKINIQYAFSGTKITAVYKHSFIDHIFTVWNLTYTARVNQVNTNITVGMDYFDFYLTLGWEINIK